MNLTQKKELIDLCSSFRSIFGNMQKYIEKFEFINESESISREVTENGVEVPSFNCAETFLPNGTKISRIKSELSHNNQIIIEYGSGSETLILTVTKNLISLSKLNIGDIISEDVLLCMSFSMGNMYDDKSNQNVQQIEFLAYPGSPFGNEQPFGAMVQYGTRKDPTIFDEISCCYGNCARNIKSTDLETFFLMIEEFKRKFQKNLEQSLAMPLGSDMEVFDQVNLFPSENYDKPTKQKNVVFEYPDIKLASR